MSFKKSLLMLLILVGVILYIGGYELPQEEKRVAAEKVLQGTPFVAFSSVHVKSPSGEFVLKNSAPQSDPEAKESADWDKSWTIEGISDPSVDRFALSTLKTAIEDLKADYIIPQSELSDDLSVYGLKIPEATFVLKRPAQELTINLGKKSDYLSKRYGKISGAGDADGIGLYNETLFSAVKPRDDFRQRSPIDFVDGDLKSIFAEIKGESMRFERGNDGTWKLTQPFEVQASQGEVASLLRELRNLKAAEFVDQPKALSAYKLDKPELNVRLEFSDSTRQAIEVKASRGPKDKDIETTFFQIGGRPIVFKAAAATLATVFKGVDQYRNRQLFTFDQNELTRFVYEAGAQTLTIERVGVDWKVDGKAGDDVFIRGLFSSLSQLEAASFPKAQSDFGFASPRAKFVVTTGLSGAEPKTQILLIGASTKTEGGEAAFFAHVGDEAQAFIVTEEALKKVSPRAETLLKIEPTPTPVEAATGAAATLTP